MSETSVLTLVRKVALNERSGQVKNQSVELDQSLITLHNNKLFEDEVK